MVNSTALPPAGAQVISDARSCVACARDGASVAALANNASSNAARNRHLPSTDPCVVLGLLIPVSPNQLHGMKPPVPQTPVQPADTPRASRHAPSQPRDAVVPLSTLRHPSVTLISLRQTTDLASRMSR